MIEGAFERLGVTSTHGKSIAYGTLSLAILLPITRAYEHAR